MSPSNASVALGALVAAAQSSGATVVETPAGTIVVLPRRGATDPDELLRIADAARVAATSVRIVKDAIRSGALPALGRQRDRAVRRGDLHSWIESRRSPVARIAEDQQARVEHRLARTRRSSK